MYGYRSGVRYVTWVESVLRGLEAAERPTGGGVGLGAVAEQLGLEAPDDASYRAPAQAGHALMTAMYDLHDLSLVEFENYAHSNRTTREGRDAIDGDLPALKAQIHAIHVTDDQRRLLAQLYMASAHEGGPTGDLTFVDAEAAWNAAGLSTEDWGDKMARFRVLRDMEDKQLIRPETHAMGNESYRPTYAAAVLLVEPESSQPGNRFSSSLGWRRNRCSQVTSS